MRPDKLDGKTHKVRLACGALYVTVNLHDSKPHEVFAHLGKSGGCARAHLEGVARLVSELLQRGASADRVVHHLAGISCHARLPGLENQASSCEDAMARILRKYVEEEKKP